MNSEGRTLMTHSITVDKERGFVRLDFSGNPEGEPEIHQQLRELLIDECEKHDVANVLVCMPDHIEMMGSDSALLYDFGATFTHKRIPPHSRIAIVRSKQNLDVSFIGAAARTHGVKFREFDSSDEAIIWLTA